MNPHYLYKTPSGGIEVLNHKIPEETLNGFVFVRELNGPVDVSHMVLDQDGNLVDRPLSYAEMRRREYPKIADQLDALWHAMDDFAIPRAEPFYSSILAVKQKYPKK